MIQECTNLTSDVSVIQRLIFAARNINPDAPGYWDLVTSFGFKSSPVVPGSKNVQVCMENLHSLDEESFMNDRELKTEPYKFDGYQGHLIGIVFNFQQKQLPNVWGKIIGPCRPSKLSSGVH